MIDKAPLDLFGSDEPEPAAPDDTPPDTVQATAHATAINCPWCAATVPAGARTCPACEARIPLAEPATPALHDGTCQWCGAAIEAGVDICPACGWDARGDSEVDLPGLTTPFSDEQIRSLYGGDEPEADIDDSIALAADIISLILPHD